MKETRRKCFKCERSPHDDPDVKLYRFPQPGTRNSLRCELWAKYCFPNEVCSTQLQMKLYAEHRMLCDKHFKRSSFIDFSTKKLPRDAVPEDVSIMKVYVPVVSPSEIIAGRSRPALVDIPTVDETEAPAHSRIAAPDSVISCPSTSISTLQSSAPNSMSSEPLMDVEWLEEEIPSPSDSQTFTFPPSTSTQPAFPPSTSTQPAFPPSTSTQPVFPTSTSTQPVYPPSTSTQPAFPPSTYTQPAFPSATETQPAEQQPRDVTSSREDRHARCSTSAARRSRSQRQIHRTDRMPRWVYEIESRRIAAEERHATALETLVELVRDIRSDINTCVNNLNSDD